MYQRKHYVISSGWSQTQPYRLQDQLHSLEQRVGWKIGKQMGKKSSRCKFFLWGIPPKCVKVANFLCCVFLAPKEKRIALLLPKSYPSLDGRSG